MTDSARLFALLDLSSADALINTWNDKYHWNFWRPITAIRKADIDGNPATLRDATWKPLSDPSVTDPGIIGLGPPTLLTGPPYPEHPSGATAYASAGEQRLFHRFSDLTNEVLEARIWAGIHFRNADVQAANLGREVVDYVHTHQFAFVH